MTSTLYDRFGSECNGEQRAGLDDCAGWDANHRDEPDPARQRLLRHLHLPACGDRGLRVDHVWSRPQQLFCRLHVGALRCERIIERIGHIRAYAAFAGLVIAATTAMPLLPGPLSWLALRVVVGFGCAGIFTATESWLNAKAEPVQRGRVFSTYMFGTFVALALGQLLIGRTNLEAVTPFNTIAALFAVALVMVSATRANRPAGPRRRRCPSSTSREGHPSHRWLRGERARERHVLCPRSSMDAGRRNRARDDSNLHAGRGVGGLAIQVPVGRLSDRFDRRVANAHDRMPADRVVAVSAWLILIVARR